MLYYAIPTKKAWLTAMAEPDHENELVQRLVAEDDSALCELYAAYGQRLYAYALRLTGEPALAEDVLQEALVVVWRTAKNYRGEGRLIAWMLGIVHHTATKALRRQSTPISDEMETTLISGDPLPEEQVQENERAAWLQRGLRSLSTEHRAVLELVFYQGLSLNETAEVCGCPVGTVKSRLNYARQQLRGVLSRTEEAR